MPDIRLSRVELPEDEEVATTDNPHPSSETHNLTSSTTTTMSPAAMDLSRRQSVTRRLSTWKKRTLTFGPQNSLTTPTTTNGDGMYSIHPNMPPFSSLSSTSNASHVQNSGWDSDREQNNLPRLRMVHHLPPQPLALASPHSLASTPQINRNRSTLAASRLQGFESGGERL